MCDWLHELTGWKTDIKSESKAAGEEMLQYASFDGASEQPSDEEKALEPGDAETEAALVTEEVEEE